MIRQVALLRGVNVGGKNKVPMNDLAAVFAAVGCEDVRTYIQSGNVVFAAPPAPDLGDRLAARIADRFGFAVPVALRTADEMAAVVAANPFTGADPDHLHVGFLVSEPAAGGLARLDPDRSPPDAFAVVGREIYLRLPNGMARTKLTNAWFDARLGTPSTMRNWRTVEALIALARR